MRIISGKFKRREIIAPQGNTTRPTSDRVRESLFNILENSIGFKLENKRVIDLFAGSGALGFESISRGASFALFVETDANARGAIRDNIEKLELFGETRIHRRSADDLGQQPAALGDPFHIAFLDPPYNKGLIFPTLTTLIEGQWLHSQALIVIEQSAKEEEIVLTETIGSCFQKKDARITGDTRVTILEKLPTQR